MPALPAPAPPVPWRASERARSEADAPAQRVGILHYPGAQAAAALGMADMLHAAAKLDARRTGHTRLHVVHVNASGAPAAAPALGTSPALPVQGPLGPAVDPMALAALESTALESTSHVREESPLTTLLLPPSLGDSPPRLTPAVTTAILGASTHGARVGAVCAGVFLLAELGLLYGRTVTTHWALEPTFAAHYPGIDIDTSRLVIDAGDVMTAGGLMAWTDLVLHVIGGALGPAALRETARFFLVDPAGREQRHYRAFTPRRTHGDAAVLAVQRWLDGHAHEPVTVTEMARVAGLGERTFLRRFFAATGHKTRAYVQHLRVDRARDLLELSTLGVQDIAWKVGYEDPGAFRRVFTRLMGLSPAAYRDRFRCTTD